MANWLYNTYALSELAEKAMHYDELTIEGGKPFAMDFLYWAGVIPPDVKWARRNAVPRKSLDADAIPAVYLAEVAYEWDDDGSADASDFIAMLHFECFGQPKNDVVLETMTDLGRR